MLMKQNKKNTKILMAIKQDINEILFYVLFLTLSKNKITFYYSLFVAIYLYISIYTVSGNCLLLLVTK